MTGYLTSMGSSDESTITVLGHDLAGELMGQVGFAELAFWLVALRRPSPGERRLFEAVLVALAEHGLTPSAIAARLTLTGAPESVPGAVAAGLLGGGSRFLGVTEDAGRFLADALAVHGGPAAPGSGTESDGADFDGADFDDADFDMVARRALTAWRAAGAGPVPGLGHNVHRGGDPRTPVLLRIADEEGLRGPHLRLFEAVGRVHPEVLGRTLPLNGAGAGGAVLCDLGFPVSALRGFALLARTAGLLGHIAEEMRRPIGRSIFEDVDRAADYQPPPAPAG
ncbi:MAG: citryl-CoA lyase [Micromonosporaceae bacterium]